MDDPAIDENIKYESIITNQNQYFSIPPSYLYHLTLSSTVDRIIEIMKL